MRPAFLKVLYQFKKNVVNEISVPAGKFCLYIANPLALTNAPLALQLATTVTCSPLPTLVNFTPLDLFCVTIFGGTV